MRDASSHGPNVTCAEAERNSSPIAAELISVLRACEPRVRSVNHSEGQERSPSVEEATHGTE